VADRDDRVRGGQRIAGQGEQAQVGGPTQLGPGQREHVGRGVGGDDPVTGRQQVPGQRAAAAAALEDAAAAHRFQQLQDAGGHRSACPP
jgi:hypothetical protein